MSAPRQNQPAPLRSPHRTDSRRARPAAGRLATLAVVGGLLLAVVVGCGGPRRARGKTPPPQTRGAAGGAAEATAPEQMSREVRDQLLEGAMDVLGNLETYEESAAFAQVFDRLNQWSHAIDDGGGDCRGAPRRC